MAVATALAGVAVQGTQILAVRDRWVVLVPLVAPMALVNGARPVEPGGKPGSVGWVDHRVVGLGLVQVALANAARSAAQVAQGAPAQWVGSGRLASSTRMH